MSDLRVVATISAKPDSQEEVRAALTELVKESRAEEGCINYELFESAAKPGTFVTVEAWAGKEALDAHMQSPHLQKAAAAFGELLSEPPAIHPLTPVSQV